MKSISRACELEAIQNDSAFYLKLVLHLINYKSTSIFIFGLIPYLSLFALESYKYLSKTDPSKAALLSNDYAEIISSSRTRVKLLDDSKRKLTGMFDLFDWIAQFQNEWHVNKHSGLLGFIKRPLQDNLGIFLYDKHIIGSTHTGLLNLGYGPRDLPIRSKDISANIGILIKSVSEQLGAYLAQVYFLLEINPDDIETPRFIYKIEDQNFGYRDFKAQKYLGAVFNGAETKELNFSLIVFLASLNLLNHIMGNLISGSSTPFFKMKFITIFHFASGLEKLQNYYYKNNLLTTRSKYFFSAILKDDDLKNISGRRSLRNFLVHYKFGKAEEKNSSYNPTLHKMIEHAFANKNYAELDQMLDLQISRSSTILEEWINWKPTFVKLFDGN
jgi:hypothetical protein